MSEVPQDLNHMSAGSARESASARLAGMDLCKVLDLDGSGVIKKVVLERSLKRFDVNVFTDGAVNELLSAFGELEDTLVSIQAFADHVSVPALPSSRSVTSTRSADVRSASVRNYMDGLEIEVHEFREVLEPMAASGAAAVGPQDIQTFKDNLKRQAKDYLRDAQHKNIRPLWEAFDRKKRGLLSIDECKLLVAAYLSALVPKSGDIVRGTIALGIELSVMLFEQRVADPVARDEMRALAEMQVETLHARVAPLVRETLEKMQREDPGALAAELLESLDRDCDGHVTRDNFERHFVEAMQRALRPERAADREPPRVSAAA